MSKEEFTLDELFSKQEENVFQFTIEQVKDKEDLVKITPWTKGAECLCSSSFEINKDLIDKVSPTGEKHLCCGKRLLVVEIKFKKDAAISLDDMFSQITAKIKSPHLNEAPPAPFEYGGMAGDPNYSDDRQPFPLAMMQPRSIRECRPGGFLGLGCRDCRNCQSNGRLICRWIDGYLHCEPDRFNCTNWQSDCSQLIVLPPRQN